MPFQPYAQIFSISLAGVTYNIRTFWNSQVPGWFFDLSDQNNNPIAAGLPFTTGDDIFSQLKYLGVGGRMYALTAGNLLAAPTLANFGGDSQVFFVTTP
jgi:hypothetical protein